MLWLAAPLTGLIVQPIIGHLSDHTWGKLGRRRPYFLTGATLGSLALVAMPNAPTILVAAGPLWILDASINISMEPFLYPSTPRAWPGAASASERTPPSALHFRLPCLRPLARWAASSHTQRLSALRRLRVAFRAADSQPVPPVALDDGSRHRVGQYARHALFDLLRFPAGGNEKAFLSVQTATFKIPDGALHDELGVAPDAKATAGRLTVELPPHSAAVYSIAQ